jgi:hypothetical protein
MELLGIQHHRFQDRSTLARPRAWAWLAFAALGSLLFSCNGVGHPGEDETAPRGTPNNVAMCVPGRAGCPCDAAGAAVSCGTLTGHYGNYVTCQMGESTCAGGVWGACAGDSQIVTKSLAPLSGPSGVHLLTTSTAACGGADACDPGCYWTIPTASDVSARGIGAAPDNGNAVTLVSSECTGLQCQIPSNCEAGAPTQLTGVVTDPSGQNPVYNAVVYIPLDPTGALTPFASGASCDSCAGTGTVQAVALTTTGPDGSFTLTNVPSTDVVPNAPIPLVVQTGKWRREQIITSVPECASTTVAPELSRLPRNHTDGNNNQADLPKIAIVTADEDALECLLLRMGVDVNEFLPAGATQPDGGAPGQNRVDLYQGNEPNYVGLPPETQLEDPGSGGTPIIMTYDAVLLPCQGGNSDLDMTRLTYASNVADYANAGGRIFTTHRAIRWLAMTSGNGNANAVNPFTNEPNPFYGAVNWNLTNGSTFTLQASIDTTLAGVTDEAGAPVPNPEGEAFATWMGDVGAGSPLVTIDQAALDVTSVNPPTSEWMRTTNYPSGDNGPLSFSFDTPVAGTAGADGGVVTADSGAGSCGRVFFNDFHVSATDRISGAGPCTTDDDCGFTATCLPAQPGVCVPTATCLTDGDCGTGFTCGPLGQNTCLPTSTHCNDGSDCRSGSCMDNACVLSPDPCATDADCGPVEMCGSSGDVCGLDCQADTDCPGGEGCMNNRCVGCFYGTDCASQACQGAQPSACSASSSNFPLACQQGQSLTPQEKALEFMLFDLTSCVAPAAFNVQPVKYEPATFTETFLASTQCQVGETVTWRELDWNATIPGDSSITFSAQTGDPAPDGGAPIWTPSTPALLATATTSTVNVVTVDDGGPDAQTDLTEGPDWDVALIDTGKNGDGGPNSVLNSQSELLLTVTLTPTSDMLQAPTLNQWRITSVCTPSE